MGMVMGRNLSTSGDCQCMRRDTAAQGRAWTLFWDQEGWFNTYGCALNLKER